jgi:hypothetical protein
MSRSKRCEPASRRVQYGRNQAPIQFFEEAKKERQRLLAPIEQSQRTIEHSRQIIARIDEVLANTDEK